MPAIAFLVCVSHRGHWVSSMFLISELNLKFMNVRKVYLAFKATTAQASVPGSPLSSTQNSLAFSLFWDIQAYVKLRNLQLSLTPTPAKPHFWPESTCPPSI